MGLTLARLVPGLALLAAGAVANAQIPHLERGLDPSFATARPVAVSQDGTVVTGYANLFPSSWAPVSYRWTAAGGPELLLPPSPWVSTVADSMSDSGDVIVGTMRDTNDRATVFRWTRTTGMQPVPEITGLSFEVVDVIGLSDDGTVICGNGGSVPGPRQAFLWSETAGLTSIDGPPGDPVRATVLSGDGSVVAGLAGLDALGRGTALFRWTSGSGVQIFPPPPGAETLFVLDMDAAGNTVVGTLVTPTGETTGFQWSPAFGFTVDSAPAGIDRSTASLISRDGDCIIGKWDTSTGVPANGPVGVYRLRVGQAPVFIPVPPDSNGVNVNAMDDVGDVIAFTALRSSPLVSRGYVWRRGSGVDALFARAEDVPTFPLVVSGDGRHVAGEASSPGNPFLTFDAAWDLEMPGSRQIGLRYGLGAAGSTGVGARIFTQGSASAAANDLALTLVNAPPDSFALFLNGTARDFQPNLAGGLGTLLIGGGIGRFVGPGQVQATGPLGTLSMPVDLAALPRPSGVVAVLPGDIYQFQAWFRDVDQGPTSNLSDAVEVSFR